MLPFATHVARKARKSQKLARANSADKDEAMRGCWTWEVARQAHRHTDWESLGNQHQRDCV